MMAQANFFERFSIGGWFKFFVISLGLVWIGTYLGQQLGWVESGIKVGLGFTIIAVILAVFLAYEFISGGLTFNKEIILPILVIVAVIVGLVFFLPKILPEMYSLGATQIQSIIGGLG